MIPSFGQLSQSVIMECQPNLLPTLRHSYGYLLYHVIHDAHININILCNKRAKSYFDKSVRPLESLSQQTSVTIKGYIRLLMHEEFVIALPAYSIHESIPRTWLTVKYAYTDYTILETKNCSGSVLGTKVQLGGPTLFIITLT